MAEFNFLPNPGAQSRFLRCQDRYPAMISGFGGGKTWAGSAKLAMEHCHFSGTNSLAVEPTHTNLLQIMIPALQERFAEAGVPSRLHGEPLEIRTPTLHSKVLLHSGLTAERITGFEVGRAWIDEPARIPDFLEPRRNVWIQTVSRIRAKGMPSWAWKLWITGTHEGKGTWVYRDWELQPKAGHVVYRGSTDENPDAIDYAKLISREFGPELAEQYRYGLAVSDERAALSWGVIEAMQTPADPVELVLDDLRKYRNLYAGFDIGRTKSLDAVWVLQTNGQHGLKMRCRTVGLHIARGAPFSAKAELIDRLMASGNVVRLAIDATYNPGTAEDAAKRHGNASIVPVMFTWPMKAALVERLQKAASLRQVTIPTDDTVAMDLFAVKRVVSPSGVVKYIAPMTADGHSDRFWALALALHAIGTDPGPIEVEVGPAFETSELEGGSASQTAGDAGGLW